MSGKKLEDLIPFVIVVFPNGIRLRTIIGSVISYYDYYTTRHK